jgi:hypothetical protein
MTQAERAVRSVSKARDLCLSLRRAFLGPRALAALRAGDSARLRPAELEVGLGLAWAAGDKALIRSALATLPPERVDEDAVLATFRAAVAGDAMRTPRR